MAVLRARRNPIGLPLHGTPLVRVGSGEHTHVLNPRTQQTLCRSGLARAGGEQQLFKSEATQATCYRCIKLAQVNAEAGREPWQDGR